MRLTYMTAAAVAAAACAWGAGLAWQTSQVQEFPDLLGKLLDQNSGHHLTLQHELVSKSGFSGVEWKMRILTDGNLGAETFARFEPGFSPKFTFTDWKLPGSDDILLEGADPAGEMRLTPLLEPVSFDLRWKQGTGESGRFGAGFLRVEADVDDIGGDTGRAQYRSFRLDGRLEESVLGSGRRMFAFPGTTVSMRWDADKTEAHWEYRTDALSAGAREEGLALELFLEPQSARMTARRAGDRTEHRVEADLHGIPSLGFFPGDFDMSTKGRIITPWPMWTPCIVHDIVLGVKEPEVIPGACPLPEMSVASTMEKYTQAILDGKAWSETDEFVIRTRSVTVRMQGAMKIDPETGRTSPLHTVFEITDRSGEDWQAKRWTRALGELEKKGAFRRTGDGKWESDIVLQREGEQLTLLGNGVEMDVILGL